MCDVEHLYLTSMHAQQKYYSAIEWQKYYSALEWHTRKSRCVDRNSNASVRHTITQMPVEFHQLNGCKV